MIRKLNKDDIDQVTQIWLEVNTRTHNFIPERYWTEQFNAVKEILPQSEVYVYEQGDEILGFVGLSDNYIAGIFVSTISQSKGIGRELLNYAKSIKTELSLSVYQKNERAIKFYQRESFIIEAEKIDENTGEQEFLMLWER
ncbi:GNAT family N-acetyltransferase [Paenibacillus massiliensis]|uniref:GNAT family N-acetyltransferase n=1 Tax=Paenibacillus massiliensis TaxID=225917 RepID=UPI000367161F|nr:GNAT family N-acetyltransferase [Paenibacillus massiliensis]